MKETIRLEWATDYSWIDVTECDYTQRFVPEGGGSEMITASGRLEVFVACSYATGGSYRLYGIHETAEGAQSCLEKAGFTRMDDADPFVGYELDSEDGKERGLVESWYVER